VNSVDVVLLLVLGLATLFGLWKGMVLAVGTLVAGAVGAFVGTQFSAAWVPMIEALGASPANARPIASVAMFLAGFFGTYLVAWAISKGLKSIELAWLDRLLGTVCGLGAGMIVCGVILVAAAHIAHDLPRESAIRQTGVGLLLLEVMEPVTDRMPGPIGEVVQDTHKWLAQAQYKPV